MKKYVLSESDIQLLIGLAVDQYCTDHGLEGEQEFEAIEEAVNIAIMLCDHLSGKKPFDSDIVEIAKSTRDILHISV